MTKNWKQIAEIFQQELVDNYSSNEIHQLFLMVFEFISTKKSIQYSLFQNHLLTDEAHSKAAGILDELVLNKPIQYILGEAYFYGLTLEVDDNTLIPRSETEELVHLIIEENKHRSNLRIIDIGTGTGCIPVSLSQNLAADYSAVEISTGALAVAKRNAKKYHSNIKFIQADILEWELVFDDDLKYDIIVSNPPYIRPQEKVEMHENVLNYEPHLALFIEEVAPLLFYDYISDFALKHLDVNGKLYFEINQYLSSETSILLEKKGFKSVKIIKDINGVDRMIVASV